MNIVWLILAGAAGGIIAGMGMGGGTLTIPILTLALDVEQKTAQSVNLIAFVVMSAPVLAIHVKNRLVDFPSLLKTAPLASRRSRGNTFALLRRLPHRPRNVAGGKGGNRQGEREKGIFAENVSAEPCRLLSAHRKRYRVLSGKTQKEKTRVILRPICICAHLPICTGIHIAVCAHMDICPYINASAKTKFRRCGHNLSQPIFDGIFFHTIF